MHLSHGSSSGEYAKPFRGVGKTAYQDTVHGLERVGREDVDGYPRFPCSLDMVQVSSLHLFEELATKSLSEHLSYKKL